MRGKGGNYTTVMMETTCLRIMNSIKAYLKLFFYLFERIIVTIFALYLVSEGV